MCLKVDTYFQIIEWRAMDFKVTAEAPLGNWGGEKKQNNKHHRIAWGSQGYEAKFGLPNRGGSTHEPNYQKVYD